MNFPVPLSIEQLPISSAFFCNKLMQDNGYSLERKGGIDGILET